MIFVRWRWSTDDETAIHTEIFQTKKAALSWVKGMTHRPDGEAYAVILLRRGF